jgi:hypothetical protein
MKGAAKSSAKRTESCGLISTSLSCTGTTSNADTHVNVASTFSEVLRKSDLRTKVAFSILLEDSPQKGREHQTGIRQLFQR